MFSKYPILQLECTWYLAMYSWPSGVQVFVIAKTQVRVLEKCSYIKYSTQSKTSFFLQPDHFNWECFPWLSLQAWCEWVSWESWVCCRDSRCPTALWGSCKCSLLTVETRFRWVKCRFCVSEWLSGWVSEWVGEWVDGWVSGWVSEWMGEWVGDWVGDWVSEWMGEWVSEWVGKWVSGWVSEWVGGQVSGWVSGWVGEWLDGWVSEWVSEWVGGQVSGWVDGWVSEWVSRWVSEWRACGQAGGWDWVQG